MPMRSVALSVCDERLLARMRRLARDGSIAVLACASVACEVRGVIGSNLTVGASSTTASSSVGDDDTAMSTDESDGEVRLDVDNSDVHLECHPPASGPCDHLDDDPWHAMGLGCPGDLEVVTSFVGSPEALAVHEGTLGTSGVYAPREGSRFVILSTGRAEHLSMTPAELQSELDDCEPIVCPSSDLGQGQRKVLPSPIDVRRVAADGDCADHPTLVGKGDCSNTLWSQWIEGSGAYDYVELRMRAVVPPQTDGVSYDFAFFSVEYPLWIDHESPWNDMYLAWLESESWTGNISFDEVGGPISVKSVLLDFMDAPTDVCPEPCEAPELAGFAMEGHAGTKWLTTTAPVRTGEEIEIVFALFDLTDAFFDSMVILDNFQWTCSGVPPVTNTAG